MLNSRKSHHRAKEINIGISAAFNKKFHSVSLLYCLRFINFKQQQKKLFCFPLQKAMLQEFLYQFEFLYIIINIFFFVCALRTRYNVLNISNLNIYNNNETKMKEKLLYQ